MWMGWNMEQLRVHFRCKFMLIGCQRRVMELSLTAPNSWWNANGRIEFAIYFSFRYETSTRLGRVIESIYHRPASYAAALLFDVIATLATLAMLATLQQLILTRITFDFLTFSTRGGIGRSIPHSKLENRRHYLIELVENQQKSSPNVGQIVIFKSHFRPFFIKLQPLKFFIKLSGYQRIVWCT